MSGLDPLGRIQVRDIILRLKQQGKHTIFGEVADQPSRDVVDKIGSVRTGGGDKPIEPVVINSVTVDEG